MESKISGHKIFNTIAMGKRNNTKRIFLMVLKVGDCKPMHRTHGGSDPAGAEGTGCSGWVVSRGDGSEPTPKNEGGKQPGCSEEECCGPRRWRGAAWQIRNAFMWGASWACARICLVELGGIWNILVASRNARLRLLDS